MQDTFPNVRIYESGLLSQSKIKIGIVTFFRTPNYGTFLQSYALCRKINESCITAEVVDVVYKYSDREDFSLLFFKRNFEYKNPIRGFRKDLKHIPLSKHRCHSNDDDRIINFIAQQQYTHLIYGSDEILKNNKRTFPTIYYPHSQLNVRNISYAVSSNRMEPDKLTDTQKNDLKARLDLYDYITVRDNATIAFFKEYAPHKEVKKIPDPTFLINFTNSDAVIDELQSKHGIDFDRPVIYFYLTDPAYIDALNHRVDKPYIAISNIHTKNVPPLAWNTIFSVSDIVFTKTYHGTIFSVKNNVPFIAFDEEAIYNISQSKINDFVSDGNLTDLYFNHRPTGEEFVDKVKYIETNREEIKSRIAAYNTKLEKDAATAMAGVINYIKNN